MNQKQSQTIALFEWKQIRKIWKEGKWYFSVIDVIAILTESSNPRDYWFKMKIRVKDESQTELSTICRQFKLVSQDGKMRETDCSDTQWVLRIIQSIPSPKAEPFKQWLAQLWQERIDEIQDPELAMKRMHEIYEKKWYPKDWIDIRTRGIPVRKWLTDEWDMRGWEKAYGILTNEIYKSYSGMDNSGWKKLKWVTS